MSRFLLIAPLLLLLPACSKSVSVQPMPLPPANLAAPCPKIPEPPEVLIDPARLQWELDLVDAYEDCAVKHRLTVEAWQGAVQATNK